MKHFAYIIILLAGCTSREVKNQGSLSLIVMTDSLIAYQGDLKDNPAIDRIPFSWQHVKKVVEARMGNDPLHEILIKPADMQNAGDNMEELVKWFKDNGFSNGKLLPMDTFEEKYFHITGMKFNPDDILAQSKPEPLHFTLPKDEKDTLSNIKTNDKTYTILLLKKNKVYIYNGTDLNKQVISTTMGDENIKNVILEGKRKFGKDFFVIIKPSKEATYKDIVDMLDEMTINDIEKYRMVDITDEEILFSEKMYNII